MNALDEGLFRWMNGWPDSWEAFFRFLSTALDLAWMKGLLAAMLIAMGIASPRTRRAALLAVLAVLLANALTDVLKAGIAFNRPYVDLPDVAVRVGRGSSIGTASAHAANMAAAAFVFSAVLGRWGWPWIALALGVGLSRIYVGVHYPSQVLIGWGCGVFAGLLAVQVHRAWGDLRNRRRDDDVTQ